MSPDAVSEWRCGMCLPYVAQVVAVHGDAADIVAAGRRRAVLLMTLEGGPAVRPGDWLLVHAGLALRRLPPEEAAARERLLAGVEGESDDR